MRAPTARLEGAEKPSATAWLRQSRPPWTAAGLGAVASVVYVMAFLAFYPIVGTAATTGAILPVVAVAWSAGLRLGLLAGLLTILSNSLLLLLAGEATWLVVLRPGGAAGTFAILLVGAITGRARDVRAREERQLAERSQTLQDSEERYRRLFESNPHPMWVYDLDTLAFLAVNDAAVRHYGYSRGEFLAMTIKNIRPAEDVPALLDNVSRVTAGLDEAGVWRHLKKDGTLVDVEITSHTLVWAGRPAEVVLANDVTLRNWAEAALRDSQARLAGIIDSAMDAIISLDAEQRIIHFNPAAERMFRCPAAEALGQPLDRFIPERFRQAHREHVRVFGQTNQTTRSMGALGPLSCLRADGEEFPAEISISQTEMAGRKIYTAILRDVTARQRAERVQAALYCISEAALSARDLDDLYRTIHATIGGLMPARNFYIALYDAATDALSFPYFVDEYDEAGSPKPPGRGLTEFVLRTGKPLLAPPDVFDALVQSGEVDLVGENSIDWLGVPLKAADETIGVLAVQTYAEGVRYTEEHRDILSFVSAQVTQAIARKRAEQALQESEALRRLIIESEPECVKLVAPDGRLLEMNPAGLAMIEADSLAQVKGAPLLDLVAPEYRQVFGDLHERVMRGEAGQLEFEIIGLKGTRRWLETTAVPLRDGQQEVKLLLGLTRDITERKRAEEALRRYARRLEDLHAIDRAILAAQSMHKIARAALSRLGELTDCQHADVVLFDFGTRTSQLVAAYDRGDVPLLSGRFKPVWDMSPAEVIRQSHVFYVEDLAALDPRSPNLNGLLAAGVRCFITAPLVTDGQLIGILNLASAQSAAFTAEHRNIAREVADQLAIAIRQARLHEDLQRHAAELEQRVAERTRELAEANERLKELDRLKSKFVSDVSHELRQPVANLKLYVDLLDRGKSEKREHYMAVLKGQAQRLTRLVEDILNLSRLEMGGERAAFAPVDLNALVEQVIVAHQPGAGAAGLRLRFEPAALPRVSGEVNQLGQMATNLVANAIAYTPSGSVRVSTRTDAERGQVCLQVQDTGMGIDPEDVPHLFERFYRGRRATQSDIPGTGLGLAIVKEIVDLHGGRIEVESAPDEGSTFRVWLPSRDRQAT